jgi:hypothetical protein
MNLPKCPVCNTLMITGECIMCKSKHHEEKLLRDGEAQMIICPDCRAESKGDLYLGVKLPKYELCVICEDKRRNKNHSDHFNNKVPPRYSNVKITDGPDWDNGIFWGNFGTGKTWAAYAIALRLGKSFEVKTEIGIINHLKAGFKNGDFETREQYLKNLGFLAVDEFGKIPESEFNRAQMFEILNYRYDYELPTVIIVNCNERKELDVIVPLDVMDRFRSHNRHFKGVSRR